MDMSIRPIHGSTSSTGTTELVGWLEGRLRQAGFDPTRASELAHEGRIDFHALLELIDRGCPPDLAERIVAPLDDDEDDYS
jgi:hypothetical protein